MSKCCQNSHDLNERYETFSQEFRENKRLLSMGAPRSKKVPKKGGTFIEKELYESDAFISLKGVAPQMLVMILGKRRYPPKGKTRKKMGYVCLNKNDISLTYAELEALGITKPRITRGFDELLAKGFIKVEHAGGGYKKDKSIYALSDEWRSWKKGDVIFKRPKVINKGFMGSGFPEKDKSNTRECYTYTHMDALH